jgi:hypothetical protein
MCTAVTDHVPLTATNGSDCPSTVTVMVRPSTASVVPEIVGVSSFEKRVAPPANAMSVGAFELTVSV